MERGGKRNREGSKLVPALCRVYFDLREWHAIKLITFGGGREGSKEEVEEERRRRKRVIQSRSDPSHTYPHHQLPFQGVLLCSGTGCQLTSLSLCRIVAACPSQPRSPLVDSFEEHGRYEPCSSTPATAVPPGPVHPSPCDLTRFTSVT